MAELTIIKNATRYAYVKHELQDFEMVVETDSKEVIHMISGKNKNRGAEHMNILVEIKQHDGKKKLHLYTYK